MTSKIKSISSPSHPIEFNSGDTPNSASVSLANQDDVGVPLLKDFEMRIALANPDKYPPLSSASLILPSLLSSPFLLFIYVL